MKKYTPKNISKAILEIKNSERSIAQASKRYKIPESTLRSRCKGDHNGRKKKYSDEDVGKAVCDIKSNILTVREASKEYNIPRTTLRDRLNGKHTNVYGSSTVLSTEQEERLAEWIILCAQSGYPKSRSQIIRTAAEISNLNHDRKFLKAKPTSGWFQKFLQRHPNVSNRKPEPLGQASASITAEGLKNYFDLIKNQFDESGRSDLLNKPQSWWNVDETGFEMNPTPQSVYTKKGAKTVHIIERGNPKENITCTYAVCADGRYIPPLVTFKETFSNLDLAAYVSKDVGANFGCNHTESGWMKGEAFYYFVTQHLYPRWIKMGEVFPIVLVIDGYSAHKSTKLFIWCKEHDVILLLLYPNSTHLLQTLDIGIFAPLKVKYTDLHEVWKEFHTTEKFTELEFIKVLKATNDEIIKPTTIINGWRATGLQPFNFHNLKLDKLVTNAGVETRKNDDSLQQVNTVHPIIVPCDSEISSLQEVNDRCNEVVFEVDAVLHPVEYLDLSDVAANGDVDLVEPLHDRAFNLNDDENSNTLSTRNESENTFSDENTDSNDSTSFAIIHKNIGLFANNFDDAYADTDFMLDGNLLPENQSTSEAVAKQVKKLVDKTRDNIRQLGICLKVHDPSKMLNVLIMAQQLLIIDPVKPTVEITAPRTMEDILNVPTTARTKRLRNKKLSFGIMSDTQIVDTVEELIMNEKEIEKQRESDKILATELSKEIESLESVIKEDQAGIQQKRDELKALKVRKATEKKESVKRQRENVSKKKELNGKQLKPAPTIQSPPEVTSCKKRKK